MRESKTATPVASSRPAQGRGSSHAAGVALRYADPAESAGMAQFWEHEARRYLRLSLIADMNRGVIGDWMSAQFAEEGSRAYTMALYLRGEIGYVVD